MTHDEVYPRIQVLEDDVYLLQRALGPEEPSVRAVLVVGEERAALLDTLSCPADMAAVGDLLERLGRPVVVINSP